MKKVQEGARRTAQVLDKSLKESGKAAAAQLKRLQQESEKLQRETDKNARKFGMGLMALGAAVEDAQYGFRSVVNNIPMMVHMFGGSAGLAGGINIAAVAINQLVEHWGELMSVMQSGWLNVPADHLEKLRIRAEKAGEAFDKLMATPSKIEARQIDAITAAFVEGDPAGARAGLIT